MISIFILYQYKNHKLSHILQENKSANSVVVLQRLMGDKEVSGAPPDGGVLHRTMPAATIERPFLFKMVSALLLLPTTRLPSYLHSQTVLMETRDSSPALK